MDVTLIAIRPDASTVPVRLHHHRSVIGRQKSCNLRVPVSSVSREHCEVRITDSGVVVRDLGSSNGTFVNRKRIQEQELTAGDLITVGPAIFLVQIGGEPAEYDAAMLLEAGTVAESRGAAAVTPPTDRPPVPTKEAQTESSVDLGSLVPDESESSSEWDFDFSDDDEDQPKL